MTRLGSFRLARRGARVPLRQQLHALELARLLQATPKLAARDADLVPLLERVWRRRAGAVWAVRDLRDWRLVDRAQTHRIGRELSMAWRRDGRVGRFTLVRVDVDSRDGAIWRLEA